MKFMNQTWQISRSAAKGLAKTTLPVLLVALGFCGRGPFDSQLIEHPNAEELHLGSLVYAQENCSNCHGIDWNGQGPEAAALKSRGTAPTDFTAMDVPETTPVDYFKAITKGTDKLPGHSYQHVTDRGRWAAAHFLFSLAPKLRGAKAETRAEAMTVEFAEAREAYARAEARGNRRWELGYKPYGEREPKPDLDEMIRSTGTNLEQAAAPAAAEPQAEVTEDAQGEDGN